MKRKSKRIALLFTAAVVAIAMLTIPVTASAASKPGKMGRLWTVSTYCNGSNKYVICEFKKVKGASKYQVYRATSKKGKYKKVATTKKTGWGTNSAKYYGLSYFKARGIKGSKAGKFSPGKSIYLFGGTVKDICSDTVKNTTTVEIEINNSKSKYAMYFCTKSSKNNKITYYENARVGEKPKTSKSFSFKYVNATGKSITASTIKVPAKGKKVICIKGNSSKIKEYYDNISTVKEKCYKNMRTNLKFYVKDSSKEYFYPYAEIYAYEGGVTKGVVIRNDAK